MTNFKTGSTLTTGTDVGDTEPGFLIRFAASHPAGQGGYQIVDFENAPIFSIPDIANGKAACYGDYFGARKSTFDTGTIRADGNPTRNPACFLFPDGTAAAGLRLWAGTGPPGTRTFSGTASSTGDDTIAVASHGLPTTASPVVFTAVSFTSSPSITLDTTTYYVKQHDANSLKIYTSPLLSVLVDITSNSTCTFRYSNIGGAASVGDLYIRLDTPTTSNQRMYRCTTAGTPGTWTAIR
jgi:hypothetical protein